MYDRSSRPGRRARRTLNSGLGLGVPYTVKGLPTGVNAVTGTPWPPAVDGIRNFTGKVGADGSVTLYGATTSVGGVQDPADRRGG